MNIQWIGSPNFATGRGGNKPLAIINHIMCGTLDGTDSWFKNPSSQVSAHFGVGKDGSIHQYVKEEDTAWANGRKSSPDQDWLSQFPAVNPNQWTISIEHEGYPDQPFTPEQIAATVELHKYLVDKWDIPVDNVHITGHFRIDSVSRKDCPGPNFPWTQIFDALKPKPASDKMPYDANQFAFLARTAIKGGGDGEWAKEELAKMMNYITNGASVSFNGKSIDGAIVYNKVFVPVADVLKLLGHAYTWDDTTKTVKVVK